MSFSRLLLSNCVSLLRKTQPISSGLASRGFSQVYEKCVNKVTLLGRVGTGPTVRGNQETPVVIFSLATNLKRRANDSDELIDSVDWHRISVFSDKLRDMCMNYLKKGHRVMVFGRINYSKIMNTDGSATQITNIHADEIIFLSGGKEAEEVEVD